MSRRRQSLPFSRYSLSPERKRRRVTTISPEWYCCWLNLRRRILRTTEGGPVTAADVAGSADAFSGRTFGPPASPSVTAAEFGSRLVGALASTGETVVASSGDPS